MKIVFMSYKGRSCHYAWLLKKQGHKVTTFIKNTNYEQLWQGIDCGQVFKMPDCKGADLVVFDTLRGGRTADRLRAQGLNVFGSSAFTDSLCTDKEFLDIFTEGKLVPEAELLKLDHQQLVGIWLSAKPLTFTVEVFRHKHTNGLGEEASAVFFLRPQDFSRSLFADLLDKLRAQDISGVLTWDATEGLLQSDLGEVFWMLSQGVGIDNLLLDQEDIVLPNYVCGIKTYTDAYESKIHKLSIEQCNSTYMYDVWHDGENLFGGRLSSELVKKNKGSIETFFVAKSGHSREEAYLAAVSEIESIHFDQKYYRTLLPQELVETVDDQQDEQDTDYPADYDLELSASLSHKDTLQLSTGSQPLLPHHPQPAQEPQPVPSEPILPDLYPSLPSDGSDRELIPTSHTNE